VNARGKPDSTAANTAEAWVLRITVAMTVAALALSYRNQVDFASSPAGGYPLWGAIVFPFIIDSFVVVGELLLFACASRAEKGWRLRAWAWTLALGGLIASAFAGMAHLGLGSPGSAYLAAAVAPLAAAASLGTGLGIVKRNASKRKQAGQSRQETATATILPDAADRPRARQPGKQPPADLVAKIRDDKAANLPTGRQAVMKRHSVTAHQARVAIKAASNGAPVG